MGTSTRAAVPALYSDSRKGQSEENLNECGLSHCNHLKFLPPCVLTHMHTCLHFTQYICNYYSLYVLYNYTDSFICGSWHIAHTYVYLSLSFYPLSLHVVLWPRSAVTMTAVSFWPMPEMPVPVSVHLCTKAYLGCWCTTGRLCCRLSTAARRACQKVTSRHRAATSSQRCPLIMEMVMSFMYQVGDACISPKCT